MDKVLKERDIMLMSMTLLNFEHNQEEVIAIPKRDSIEWTMTFDIISANDTQKIVI